MLEWHKHTWFSKNSIYQLVNFLLLRLREQCCYKNCRHGPLIVSTVECFTKKSLSMQYLAFLSLLAVFVFLVVFNCTRIPFDEIVHNCIGEYSFFHKIKLLLSVEICSMAKVRLNAFHRRIVLVLGVLWHKIACAIRLNRCGATHGDSITRFLLAWFNVVPGYVGAQSALDKENDSPEYRTTNFCAFFFKLHYRL
jgi:hypothetical protein